MLKICSRCGNGFPSQMDIDGKIRNLTNRKACLICVPFKSLRIPRTKETESARMRRRYVEQSIAISMSPMRALRLARKGAIVSLLGKACQLCSYDKYIGNLSFHHLSDKIFSMGDNNFQRGPDQVIKELQKCIMVCHNCHGEIHAGLVANSDVIAAHTLTNDLLQTVIGLGWRQIIKLVADNRQTEVKLL